jgi:hypothetical protein
VLVQPALLLVEPTLVLDQAKEALTGLVEQTLLELRHSTPGSTPTATLVQLMEEVHRTITLLQQVL